jgi:hypothetical protein
LGVALFELGALDNLADGLAEAGALQAKQEAL